MQHKAALSRFFYFIQGVKSPPWRGFRGGSLLSINFLNLFKLIPSLIKIAFSFYKLPLHFHRLIIVQGGKAEGNKLRVFTAFKIIEMQDSFYL